MMKHLSYGFKNAAPIAQDIMNALCMVVGDLIGFIDDGAMKHNINWGTKELIEHLETLFIACDKLGVLLHPEKFFPFCTEVISLGIHLCHDFF